MTSPSPSKSRLSTAEASAYAGVPSNTLRYWRHLDTGPTSYRIGTRVVYDVADLDAWLAAEKAKTARGGAQ